MPHHPASRAEIGRSKEPSDIPGSPCSTRSPTRDQNQWRPTPTQCLATTLGLPDRLWASASEPTELVVHRYSGRVLAREADFDKTMRARYRAPFVDVHRVDLQLSLCERARALGVRLRLGERVRHIDFEDADGPALTTQSGTRARADLIVAADGLWSRARACYLDRDDPPLATGDLAYRVVLDAHAGAVADDPELRAWVAAPKVHFWIGPGAHCVGYSMRAETMYNLVLLVPDDLPPGVSRQAGSVEEMRARFRGWDPILGKLLGAVDKVEKWKLMHRKIVPPPPPPAVSQVEANGFKWFGAMGQKLTRSFYPTGEELTSWVNDKSNFVFV
ncbi:3-hydroxybenzoate 6-hydroxylase [Colletotrichum tanaceti]|uniref:3-hydroxybenzoate 6-hydroxylase n=1 Tax=Colletotrichum tanaceti TaxID=1306861 RepID=A0A4U6XK46_9PEZI|nr:3-hydroxybenzoate 6-hydroxylase [Colletotrichum tanaceti]